MTTTKVRTRPRPEIARFHGEIHEPSTAHVAMDRLCEHVANSPYRDLVFAATSMHTLLVGQHETLEWNSNVLRVEPKSAERITLSFHEKEFVDAVVWTCAPEAVVETFERFLRRAKWVSEEALGGPSG